MTTDRPSRAIVTRSIDLDRLRAFLGLEENETLLSVFIDETGGKAFLAVAE